MNDMYDITDLLGFPITSEERTELLRGYLTLILERFFTQKLPDLLEYEHFLTLKGAIKHSSTPDTTWDEFIQEVPELETQLELFSQEQKKEILHGLYLSKLHECEKLFSSSLSNEKKEQLTMTYDKYARAIDFLAKNDWDRLYLHLNPTS